MIVRVLSLAFEGRFLVQTLKLSGITERMRGRTKMAVNRKFTAEEGAAILKTDMLEEETVTFSDDSSDAEDSDPEFVPACDSKSRPYSQKKIIFFRICLHF